MVRAVLFDLDGTLLNRDWSVQRFVSEQYDRLNNALGHIAKNNYTNRFIELGCRGYVWKDKVYQQLVDEYGITDITWEKLLKDYLDNFHYHCVPFPDLIPMLEALQNDGLLLGIITNGKGQFQLNNIRALGIEKYMNAILISELEGLKKPDTKIFRRAPSRLNISPEEAVFVGDNPEKDISAAYAVGMITVWKRNDLSYDDEVTADYIIDDLMDLSKLFKEGRK